MFHLRFHLPSCHKLKSDDCPVQRNEKIYILQCAHKLFLKDLCLHASSNADFLLNQHITNCFQFNKPHSVHAAISNDVFGAFPKTLWPQSERVSAQSFMKCFHQKRHAFTSVHLTTSAAANNSEQSHKHIIYIQYVKIYIHI